VTERATGRHRATQKSSSALSTLTGSLSVVGDCVGSVRRSGVIIAMSSGLVASMGLPAHAVAPATAEASGQTAGIPMLPASGAAAESFLAAPETGVLATPADLTLTAGSVRAATTATLDWDPPSIIAVPNGSGGLTVAARPGAAPAHTSAPATPAAPMTTRRSVKLGSSNSTSTKPASAKTGSKTSANVPASASGSSAVSIGTRYLGVPYRWGATGPNAFDCSGLVQYVYGQLGIALPRTVAAQRGAVRMVPRSQARAGDLVFFGDYHVGILVDPANNTMLDAPHSGASVTIRQIWTANVAFGRP
jgi:cell wall-associated NlpC family hydrolase